MPWSGIYICSRGVKGIYHHLDNFIIAAPPASDHCSLCLSLMQEECTALGVRLAQEEVQGPTTCLTFLGIDCGRNPAAHAGQTGATEPGGWQLVGPKIMSEEGAGIIGGNTTLCSQGHTSGEDVCVAFNEKHPPTTLSCPTKLTSLHRSLVVEDVCGDLEWCGSLSATSQATGRVFIGYIWCVV